MLPQEQYWLYVTCFLGRAAATYSAYSRPIVMGVTI